MKKDPVIEKIRKTRHEISQEFKHDIKAILDYYRSLENHYKERIYRKSGVEEKTSQPSK